MSADVAQPKVRLSTEAVGAIFMDCLFSDGEDHSEYVKAEGISATVGFHPGRLEGHRAEIVALLEELPDEFQAAKGGGWSFLNACNDKHGEQWTSFHQAMDQLFMLGTAIGRVSSLMPREMWSALPGGMPYYQVLGGESP